MAGKNTAVFALFQNQTHAERAVDLLLDSGFRSDDVSVLAPDQKTTKEFATEKNTKAPEGTTTGAVSGGAIGGTLGLLAGIGALAIPASDLSSRQVLLWGRSQVWAPVPPQAA